MSKISWHKQQDLEIQSILSVNYFLSNFSQNAQMFYSEGILFSFSEAYSNLKLTILDAMFASGFRSEISLSMYYSMYIVLHIGIARMGRQGQDLNYYGQERMVKFFRSYLHIVLYLHLPTFANLASFPMCKSRSPNTLKFNFHESWRQWRTVQLNLNIK